MISPDTLWPEFTHAYALLIIPLLWLLIYWLQRSHAQIQHWEHILPPALHTALLSRTKRSSHRTPVFLLSLASLCIGLALSGPRWSHQPQSSAITQIAPLVIVIQLTPDSLATDLAPNRLQRIQHKTMQLLQLRQGALTGIVVYAGTAHTLVPLSNDLHTSRNLVHALKPSLMPSPGQDAALAIIHAQKLMQQSGQQHGGILLITSSLTQSEQDKLRKTLKKSPYALHIMGVGTPLGAPMFDEQHDRLISDASGTILISRLDERTLMQFAQQQHARYARITANHEDLNRLGLSRYDSQGQAVSNTMTRQSNQGYWFILPLLIVLPPLARRGWFLTILPIFMLQPQLGHALELDNLWKNNNKTLEQVLNDPQQALVQLKDPMWLGIAAYHAQNYSLAVDYFSTLDSAEAHYNRGNALMRQHNYQAAIEAYRLALSKNHSLDYAYDNLKLAQRLLNPLQIQTEKNNPQTKQPIEVNALSNKTIIVMPSQQKLSLSHSQESGAALHTEIDLQTWLEQIPDNPGELLKHKFWHEQLITDSP